MPCVPDGRGRPLDALASARDEGHPGAARMQLADERQAQAGGAAGDRDAQPRSDDIDVAWWLDFLNI